MEKLFIILLISNYLFIVMFDTQYKGRVLENNQLQALVK